MNSSIHFTITTPDGTLFKGDVKQITLTTSQGQITILPNHIPLVSDIVSGEAVVVKDGGEIPFILYGGFVEVRPKNEVMVLADSGERPETINIQEAEEARERARKVLAEKFEPSKYQDAAFALERELVRVRLARKYQKRFKSPMAQSGEKT